MKVAIALLVVLALAGCGSTTVDSADPSTRDVRPQRVLKGPELSPDPTRAVTPCSRLLAEGWEPAPFNDFDVNTSPSLDFAEFNLENERLYLGIRNDEACQHLPTLGPVIVRLLAESEIPVASNAAALAKGLALFERWDLQEAEPPHGSPSAVLWGRTDGRTLLATVFPPGVAQSDDGEVIDAYEIAGVVVETIQHTGQQVLVRFTHGGFVINVAVLVGDQLEPDLEQTRALVDGLLCPGECG